MNPNHLAFRSYKDEFGKHNSRTMSAYAHLAMIQDPDIRKRRLRALADILASGKKYTIQYEASYRVDPCDYFKIYEHDEGEHKISVHTQKAYDRLNIKITAVCEERVARICGYMYHRYYKTHKYIRLHSLDGPAYDNGSVQIWFIHGKISRDEGPAIITSDYIMYACGGLLHNEHGPAIVHSDGTKEWFQGGERHREDGPAFLASGIRRWYIRGDPAEGVFLEKETPEGLVRGVNTGGIYRYEYF